MRIECLTVHMSTAPFIASMMLRRVFGTIQLTREGRHGWRETGGDGRRLSLG
jgi:hypothetical protein